VVPEELRTRAGPASPPTAPEPYMPEGKPGIVVFGLALQTAVMDWLLLKAYEQTGIWVADEPTVRPRMAKMAEMAMRELKTNETFDISMPFLTADASGPKHFAIQLSRAVVDEVAQTPPQPLEKPQARKTIVDEVARKPPERPKKKGLFGR
jgi:hypothetical protein